MKLIRYRLLKFLIPDCNFNKQKTNGFSTVKVTAYNFHTSFGISSCTSCSCILHHPSLSLSCTFSYSYLRRFSLRSQVLCSSFCICTCIFDRSAAASSREHSYICSCLNMVCPYMSYPSVRQISLSPRVLDKQAIVQSGTDS